MKNLLAAVLAAFLWALPAYGETQRDKGYVLIVKLSDGTNVVKREISDSLLEPGSDGGPFTTPSGCAVAALQMGEGPLLADNGNPYVIIERLCVPDRDVDAEMNK